MKNRQPEFLTDDGHSRRSPAWANASISQPEGIDLKTHINDVVNLESFSRNLHDVVLTSYGGMVITGVMDRVPDRIRHVVFFDAHATTACRFTTCWRSRAGANVVDGMMQVPWVKPGTPPRTTSRNPSSALTNRFFYENSLAKSLPVTYVAFVPKDKSTEERAATDKSWQRAVARAATIRTFPAGVTSPSRNHRGVAALMEEAVATELAW